MIAVLYSTHEYLYHPAVLAMKNVLVLVSKSLYYYSRFIRVTENTIQKSHPPRVETNMPF